MLEALMLTQYGLVSGSTKLTETAHLKNNDMLLTDSLITHALPVISARSFTASAVTYCFKFQKQNEQILKESNFMTEFIRQ